MYLLVCKIVSNIETTSKNKRSEFGIKLFITNSQT